MVFEYDEDNPLQSSFIADFPPNEVLHRKAVQGSVNVEHWAETTGRHRQVAMVPLDDDPDPVLTNGFLYTKDVDTITELFYMDDDGTPVQLTSGGSASPDKLPLAGGEMSGILKLANELYIQSYDNADANWRNLIGVDSDDVAEFGSQALAGGARLNVDTEDLALVAYGEGDKKIWHEGHFATAPLFIATKIVADQTMEAGTAGSVAHDIGVRPALWGAAIKCTDTDMDYVVGDLVPVMHGVKASGGRGLTVFQDGDTHFGWNLAEAPHIFKKTTGNNQGAIDLLKWVLVFQAWY